MFAGACGAIISNPFEVAMVRNISDLGKTAQYRHSMGSVGECLSKIGAEKRGYYRGLGPSLLKAAILNGTLIGPYDYIKERMFTTFGDVWPNTLVYAYLTQRHSWSIDPGDHLHAAHRQHQDEASESKRRCKQEPI